MFSFSFHWRLFAQKVFIHWLQLCACQTHLLWFYYFTSETTDLVYKTCLDNIYIHVLSMNVSPQTFSEQPRYSWQTWLLVHFLFSTPIIHSCTFFVNGSWITSPLKNIPDMSIHLYRKRVNFVVFVFFWSIASFMASILLLSLFRCIQSHAFFIFYFCFKTLLSFISQSLINQVFFHNFQNTLLLGTCHSTVKFWWKFSVKWVMEIFNLWINWGSAAFCYCSQTFLNLPFKSFFNSDWQMWSFMLVLID